MDWQYWFDGQAYTPPYTFVANGGNGGVVGTFTDGFYVYFNIIVNANSITFDYSARTGGSTWLPGTLALPPTIHNGIAIDMLLGPEFQSVTIDPVTNMVGFDGSRVSFTGSQ